MRIRRAASRLLVTSPRTVSPGSAHLPGADCALLWHADPDVRRTAAARMAGPDRLDHSHFAGALLDNLLDTGREAGARQTAVKRAVGRVLAQKTVEIQAMANMRFSFVSSALYMALFATCTDAVEAARLLRAHEAHSELVGLCLTLRTLGGTARINGADCLLLTARANSCLAAMPPQRISDFWRLLGAGAAAERQVLSPALREMRSPDAGPLMAGCLPDAPEAVAADILEGLKECGGPAEVDAITRVSAGGSRAIRMRARQAVRQITARAARAEGMLLRPAGSEALLRVSEPESPGEELVRPFEAS